MYLPQDPTTLIALMVGRDSQIMILVLVIIMLYKNIHIWTSFYRKLCHYNKATVSLEGRIVNDLTRMSQACILSMTVKSVFHYISTLKLEKAAARVGRAMYLELMDEDTSMNIKIMLPLDNTYGLQLTEHIVLFAQITQSSPHKNVGGARLSEREAPAHPVSDVEFTLDLKSANGLAHIHAFLKECERSYMEYLEKEAHDHMIIRPTWGSSGDFLSASTLPISPHKTFDNLFFEGKSQLIQRLNSFKDKSVYHRLGIPDSLGLLFHGEPGTGKTSAIKAIANYMKMNLIIVPMNQITSRRQLEALFYKKSIGLDYTVPYNRRIYVFEEIDCNGWEDVVRDRALLKEEARAQSAANVAALAARGLPASAAYTLQDGNNDDGGGSGGEKKVRRKSGKDEPLTLGAFLEMLDGIVEIPGRIVIMTTNHPEQLDAALRRPGRIDMEIEFKRLRGEHIAEIYERWCGKPFPEAARGCLRDYVYTQADVSRLIFKHEDNPEAFVQELCELEPPPLELLS